MRQGAHEHVLAAIPAEEVALGRAFLRRLIEAVSELERDPDRHERLDERPRRRRPPDESTATRS